MDYSDLMDINTLRGMCTAKISDFEKLGVVHETQNGRNYIFIDNGSNVLATAHLDTAISAPGFKYIDRGLDDITVFTPALDDRLGVYVLLYVLPKLGINVDVLLTDGEESCGSTARYFTPDKEYNWIVEFDRRGTDVVTYQYKEQEWQDAINSVGFDIGWGTYSDIADMDSLEICAMNIGTGYHFEHTKQCHAVLKDTIDMAWIFKMFYDRYKDTKFEHEYIEDKFCGAGAYYYNTEYDDWYKSDDVYVDKYRHIIDEDDYDNIAGELIDLYDMKSTNAEFVAYSCVYLDDWKDYDRITMKL